MREELLPAAAKVIQPRLPVRRLDETVLGAFAEAGELVLASVAVFGKQSFFCLAETFLMLRICHLLERLLPYIADAILRIDMMVTGIDRAVALKRQSLPTYRPLGAKRRDMSHPGLDRSLEIVHVNLAQVFSVPLIKNTNEEVSPVVGTDAPLLND